jgi:hypothetical protein
MAKYILVPLSLNEDVEKIIPRIEQVAQAGMTIIFLIPYHTNRFMKKRQMIEELSAKGISSDKKALLKYSYERQTRLADEKIAVVRERLAGRELKIIAYVYVGRLSGIVKNYKRAGNVHHVLKRQGSAIPIFGVISSLMANFSLVKRFASMLPIPSGGKLDVNPRGMHGAAHNAG